MADSLLTAPSDTALSADNVILPSTAVEGLKPVQITVMKETVFTVNNNTRIAGELLRSTAASLFELKQNLVKRQWLKFLKSGALPIPEKQARDLVSAWEGWLRDSDVTDGDLVNIGTRTMAKIKSLAPTERKKIVKRLKAGEKITERMVTAKPVTTNTLSSQVKQLKEVNKALRTENQRLRSLLEENSIEYVVTA